MFSGSGEANMNHGRIQTRRTGRFSHLCFPEAETALEAGSEGPHVESCDRENNLQGPDVGRRGDVSGGDAGLPSISEEPPAAFETGLEFS